MKLFFLLMHYLCSYVNLSVVEIVLTGNFTLPCSLERYFLSLSLRISLCDIEISIHAN